MISERELISRLIDPHILLSFMDSYRIQEMLRSLKVETNQDLFKNRDIAEAWEELHIPDDKHIAVMYVLNKSDLLRNIINRPIETSENEDDDIVPFDYRCDQAGNRPVLTSESSMFEQATHYSEFDMRSYLDCALETNHFVAYEDNSFVGTLSKVILSKKHERGITCISSNPRKPNRVVEPLAWLIECLVNKTDFSESLAEQYSKRG